MTTTTTKRIGDRAAEQIGNQISELIGDLNEWTPKALETLEDHLEQLRQMIEEEFARRDE
jgi:gas vesicle protein